MGLNGLFAPNKINLPNWQNKKGENEFEKMLDNLARIGKKITSFKKKADGDAAEVKNGVPPATTEREQPVSPATYYDATPRPLGEVFNNRTILSDQAISKAREIVGKLLGELNLPASDVYLLRTDISRFAGNGSPATGRISFQVPFMTPQGDQRTIYADVDIILGGLMPPTHFTDGLNTKYAFTPEGVNELLRGRDFEMLTNPKVQPETVFFEAPGHLAGRGGYALKKIGQTPEKPEEEKIGEPDKPLELTPGTEIASAIDSLETATKDVVELQKRVLAAQKALTKKIETLEEYEKVKGLEKGLKVQFERQKTNLSGIEAFLKKVASGMVELKGRFYKLEQKAKISKTPIYTMVVGELIKLFPAIKGSVESLWADCRSMTSIDTLVREAPGEEPEEWKLREKMVTPEMTKFEPEKDTEASIKSEMTKSAALLDNLQQLVSALNQMNLILDEAGV